VDCPAGAGEGVVRGRARPDEICWGQPRPTGDSGGQRFLAGDAARCRAAAARRLPSSSQVGSQPGSHAGVARWLPRSHWWPGAQSGGRRVSPAHRLHAASVARSAARGSRTRSCRDSPSSKGAGQRHPGSGHHRQQRRGCVLEGHHAQDGYAQLHGRSRLGGGEHGVGAGVGACQETAQAADPRRQQHVGAADAGGALRQRAGHAGVGHERAEAKEEQGGGSGTLPAMIRPEGGFRRRCPPPGTNAGAQGDRRRHRQPQRRAPQPAASRIGSPVTPTTERAASSVPNSTA